MTPLGPSPASSRREHARPGCGAHTQRTVKRCRDGPCSNASGCLADLDVVGGLVPLWVPAGWHVIGNLDCACQSVWIPRVVGGHSIGNNGTVRTAWRMYGGI